VCTVKERANLLLEIYLWCDTQGSLLTLAKLSRLNEWFDGKHYDINILIASVEELVTRQIVK
jgi:hypothetical protein